MLNRLLAKGCRLLVIAIGVSTPIAAKDRPNILLCISDDQSYAHTGANGDPVVKMIERIHIFDFGPVTLVTPHARFGVRTLPQGCDDGRLFLRVAIEARLRLFRDDRLRSKHGQ